MKSGSSFLLAARQCEIAELEQLAHTGELVGAIGRFIHAVQRERGISNVFLASQGRRFGDQRAVQAAECDAMQQQVRAQFDRLDTGCVQARNGARLYSRIAVVLHGLEGVPALRQRIVGRCVPAREAAAAFSRVIAGLLAVVFEAADSASDPEVSRALVAMFNFMQAKEFAGQERALGAGVFASGLADAACEQEWRHLVEAQQGCLQLFFDLSRPEVLRAERASRDAAVTTEVERLRRLGCNGAASLDPDLSQAWYDCATRRIDAMRSVEDLLAVHLRRLCESRIAQARAELRDAQAVLQSVAAEAEAGTDTATAYGPHLERSMLSLLQEQSRRLQAMGDELDAVRASLQERKIVERAKGLLMAHRNLREDEAYKALRQMAMNQNRRLVQVAEAVLSLADVLPPAP